MEHGGQSAGDNGLPFEANASEFSSRKPKVVLDERLDQEDRLIWVLPPEVFEELTAALDAPVAVDLVRRRRVARLFRNMREG